MARTTIGAQDSVVCAYCHSKRKDKIALCVRTVTVSEKTSAASNIAAAGHAYMEAYTVRL